MARRDVIRLDPRERKALEKMRGGAVNKGAYASLEQTISLLKPKGENNPGVFMAISNLFEAKARMGVPIIDDPIYIDR